MDWILLVLGFALLIKGADWFVDASAAIATRFHIPQVIIGLTIVALGTSLPELSVSLTAAINGRNALALSNVLGSNIFNTLVVVGCSCLLRPFVLDREVRTRDVWFNLAAAAILCAFALTGTLTRLDGFVLLAFLVFYIYLLVRSVLKDRKPEEEKAETMSTGKCALLLLVGIACIGLGGNVTVQSASAIAESLGMSEALVGLTIVSIGTSLPELVTSVVAAKKGESGLSIGNALGSNILNISFILGASAAIHPITVVSENVVDALLQLALSAGILVYAKLTDKMNRATGLAFLLLYALYFAYIVMR